MTNLKLENDGLEFHSNLSGPIESFEVLGERASGTNFARLILSQNTQLKNLPYTDWKHGFPHAPVYPSNHLVIITFRRADKWARSLFSKPWEAARSMFDLSWGDFIRATWEGSASNSYYANKEKFPNRYRASQNQPHNYDLHPISGEKFENIFKLRNMKHETLLSMPNRAQNVVFVSMEYLIENPLDFMIGVSSTYKISRKRVFEEISTWEGNNRFWVARKELLPKEWSKEEYHFMKSQLDMGIEKRLGYQYEDF